VSHPHYYTTMVEGSHAFGKAPVYIHEADKKWGMRPDAVVSFWKGGSKELFGGLKLVNTGGHFEGFQVLHWVAGAKGKRGSIMTEQQWLESTDPQRMLELLREKIQSRTRAGSRQTRRSLCRDYEAHQGVLTSRGLLAVRAPREPWRASRGHHRGGLTMGMVKVVGATRAPFQASKESVTRALPGPASSGTRTGPWKLLSQHTLPSG
jgi:hypothetical protein